MSELSRYWIQNSPEDFISIAEKFIERLTAQGHDLQSLIPLFQQAALTLDTTSLPSNTKEDRSTLFIHWEYMAYNVLTSICFINTFWSHIWITTEDSGCISSQEP